MRPAPDLATLESWFDRIVETPDCDRHAALRAVPPELQQPLSLLLGSLASAEAALESPRWNLGADGPMTVLPLARRMADELLPGSRAGAYTIMDQIGRGGMGVVYRALQDHPRREVAIKLLAVPLATERASKRFERESELLARLDHPCIVPVYEAGLMRIGGGVTPYYAMRLVEGVSLGAWARASSDRQAPSWQQRLDLLIHVCEAVEHAHQRGVLHRDLKPANIVVGSDATPHVLDFGIARLLLSDTTEAPGTLGYELAGTPGYMSPEQLLKGVTDTRSDVFSLGVIAWEVLENSYPFGAAPPGFEQAVHTASKGAVRARSETSLSPDVYTVLTKAMSRDPDQRYRGAGEFADDLRRLRQGRPVRARPATVWYVVSRWVARNPWQATATAATLAVIASVSGWAVASTLTARSESRMRLRAVELAQKRLDLQREFIMQSLVHTAYTLQGIPGGHHAHAELLREALPRLEALAADAGDDLNMICDLSIALVRLGLSAGGLGTPNTGEPDLAEEMVSRAVDLAEKAVRISPDSSRPLRSLEMAIWAAASLPSGVPNRRDLYRRSVELKRRIFDLDGRTPQDEYRLAYSLQAYGSFTGDLDALHESVARFEHVLSQTPDDWDRRVAAGAALNALARQMAEEDLEQAAVHAARAESLMAAAHDENRQNYSCARHLTSARVVRGSILARLGKLQEAREVLGSALSTVAISANDPTNTLHVSDRALVCANVMLTLAKALDANEYDESERLLLMALGVRAHGMALLRQDDEGTGVPESIRAALRQANEAAGQWRAELGLR